MSDKVVHQTDDSPSASRFDTLVMLDEMRRRALLSHHLLPSCRATPLAFAERLV